MERESPTDGTIPAPLVPRQRSTIEEPLRPRIEGTIEAPLRQDDTIEHEALPRHDQTIEEPLQPRRHDTTIEAPLPPRQDVTIVAPLYPDQVVEAPPQLEPDLAAGWPPQPTEWQIEVPARPQPLDPARARERVLEAVRVVAILLAIFLGMRAVAQTFRVDGPSMAPNFESGQTLLVNKVAYWHIEGTPLEGLLPVRSQGSIDYLFSGPRRGDVVVLRPPKEAGFEADLIKRIIGLPGDVVSIQEGQVFVNGNLLEEPYVQFPADYSYPGEDVAVQVPDGSYFVLGDNRPVSADSHLGWFVPMPNIVGPALLTYWPPTRWGLVPDGDLREVPPS